MKTKKTNPNTLSPLARMIAALQLLTSEDQEIRDLYQNGWTAENLLPALAVAQEQGLCKLHKQRVQATSFVRNPGHARYVVRIEPLGIAWLQEAQAMAKAS